MKTGLVLEGGAMRGIYTAGVLDIFNENNIKVDGVIGVDVYKRQVSIVSSSIDVPSSCALIS